MSETVKFTPGPWFANGRYIGTKNHMSAIGECRDVNGNWSDDAKSSGNARLIAAAPELLEALKRANQFITNGIDLGYIRMPDPESGDTALLTPGLVRAAIAKAEGRS